MKKTTFSKLNLLLLLLVASNVVTAQTIHFPFQQFMEFKSQDENKLFFRFENFNFIKNNEYNGEFVKGSTLIGYIATPKLAYYSTDNFRVETGVRLQKYSGLEDFTETEPFFSVTYCISNKIKIILGSLNQDNNHNLSEPLFEPERFFTDNAENGLQVLWHSDHLNIDTWINWDQFIFENDPFQERFSFGLSADWRLNGSTSPNMFFVPVQVLLTHCGGEIDLSAESVKTIGNCSTGFGFTRTLKNTQVTSWTLKTLAYYFGDSSSEKEFMFDKGYAVYPQFEITTQKSQLTIGYWNAYKFAAPKGSKIFQSVSTIYPGYFEDHRELATLHYFYDHKIAKGIYLGAKLDVYYDLRHSEENFATALYLRFNKNFFLKKIAWD